MADIIETVTEWVAEALDHVLHDDAHVIAELSTASVFFSDKSGKRWRLRLEEA